MECDRAEGGGDFVCQLRRHSLGGGYGQRAPDGVLATGEAERALRRAVAGLLPVGWRGDDPVRELSVAPSHWPHAVRRVLVLPRCVDTSGLLIYLFVDCLFYVLCSKAVQLAVRLWLPDLVDPTPVPGRPWRNLLAAWKQLLIVTPAACLLVAALDTLVFITVGHWLRWMQRPPLLVTLAILAYGTTLHRLGAWDPLADIASLGRGAAAAPKGNPGPMVAKP